MTAGVWAWQGYLLHELLSSDLDAKLDATVEFLEPGHPPSVITYERIHGLACRVGASLQAAGVAEGDHVLVMLDNSAELVAALIGISHAGAVSVPINTATRGASLEYLVRQVAARAAFVAAEYEALYREALGDVIPPLVTVITGGDPAADDDVRFESFIAPDHELTEIPRVTSDAACILYTSGSTGPPKGVICSHGMMAAWAHNANLVMDYGQADRVFIALPVFHANALCCALLPGLKTGASLVISHRFSASTFFSDLKATRATTVNLLGTMEAILRKRGISDGDRAHGVQRSLVIPGPSDQSEFATTFGMRATTLYGLTDSGIPIGVPAGRDFPDGSCGRPNGLWEVQIVDENDVPVPAGEPGYLNIRPTLPGIMMLGYLKNSDATLRDWKNLWFHTSDRMRVDENGWYFFAGRSSDSIRRGGENVSAFEVEAVLNAHPAITHSAVIAVSSAVYGEEILAYLEGANEDQLDSIVAHCEMNLPYFAVPRYFEFIAELPRTLSEKVDKPRLKQLALTITAVDRGDSRRSLPRIAPVEPEPE